MSLKKSVKKAQKTPHVLVIGGGFAGITAANTLVHLSNLGEVNVTLISDKTYFEYYPAFYKVVTGAPAHEVCVPLTDMVANEVDIVVDRITSIDLKEKQVKSSKGNVYSADYLVIAIGSETIYFDLPGLKEHSFGFKSIGEAHELKNHIESLFKEKTTKKTNAVVSPSDMVSNFQVVIVGGGPSGVEVAGDLVSNMRKLAKEYAVDPSFITIDIIDRGNRLIGATHPFASAAALRRLRKLGVNVFLNREVLAEDIEKILVGDMSLKTKTVIWTAGTSVNALFKQTEGLQFTERRRVQVNDYLEAATTDAAHGSIGDVYVAGDGAGTKYSGLAQTAIRDGKFVAKDILKKIRKQDRKKYEPKDVEYIIPIGRNWALMSLGPIHIYGYFAYVARELVDFFYFAKVLSFKKTIELFWK